VHTGTHEKAKMSIKSSSQINSPYMQKLHEEHIENGSRNRTPGRDRKIKDLGPLKKA